MSKLLVQIVKFSFVGVICFVIDYLIGLIAMNIMVAVFGNSFYAAASVIASILGFVISVIVNYILSFKFVFERKENMSRKTEFIAFIFLSIIGLELNSLIIWIAVGPVYETNVMLRENFNYSMMYTLAKIVATAIVMVYNFVTRKIFLEQKKKVKK